MPDPDTKTIPRLKPELKVERPKLHKVLLVNDDFTPRSFVVTVLRTQFRLDDSQAQRVMMTAHQRGVCVVGVFTRELAEEKATAATDMGRRQGYPLLFTTEPEE
ncbi:ATP-dependent Clp protease adapter ClpS [Paeniroseomonas aquatica]|uniref:ATP-dependent Clp protease adapter protein ClpS n=1 Tax=Paeniroseomonas aquatica TaxID=373043 RepID=A0ABT7ZZ73_9PROT|nr:ATP-dependent Clp protease adapter ClpS [Paeniroseomonas aquatica]MDN3562773.1 ATP-dependent Clp protease adapter ClpS [Paeniroseomonas aquatica]